MSTNYYLVDTMYIERRNKAKVKVLGLRGSSFTDTFDIINYAIDEGYPRQLHIAQTAAGWSPLFHFYEDRIESVKALKEFYDTWKTQGIVIQDENSRLYTWDEFMKHMQKLPEETGRGDYKDEDGYSYTYNDFC